MTIIVYMSPDIVAVPAAMPPSLAYPGRNPARQSGKSRNILGWPVYPGFESFPILGRNGDDVTVEYSSFGCLDRCAVHEITQRHAVLLGRSFEKRAFGGRDADAETTSCISLFHLCFSSTWTPGSGGNSKGQGGRELGSGAARRSRGL
jgi:hypothetical protein